MNEHIKLILFVVNIAIGTIYIFYLNSVRKKHSKTFLKWLFISAILFNIFILFTFLSKYWVTNILGIMDYHKYFYLRDLIGIVVNFSLFFLLVLICFSLIGSQKQKLQWY